jgi:hypothetical protein
MGCSSGPDIVEDGLVLCLDAGSKRSYPGTGTTWTDTVSGNNGTLNNMDASNFSDDNGGTLSFDGSNENVTIAASTDYGTPEFTVCYWIYSLSQNSGYDAHLDINPSFIPNLNWSFGPATGRPELRFWINSSVPLIYDSAKNYYLEWRHLSWTYNYSQTTGRIYEDGVLVAQNTAINKTITNNATIKIGNDRFNSSTIGRFSNIVMYNRALTADEIRRNYLSTKERYQ